MSSLAALFDALQGGNKRGALEVIDISDDEAPPRKRGAPEVIEISDDDGPPALPAAPHTARTEHGTEYARARAALLRGAGYIDNDAVFALCDADVRQGNAAYFARFVPPDVPHHRVVLPEFQNRVCTGDALMADIARCFELFPMTRTYLQRMFHNKALNVIAGILYGNDWRYRRAQVMQRNSWQDLVPIMAAVCPRRFGKTIATAMLGSTLVLP